MHYQSRTPKFAKMVEFYLEFFFFLIICLKLFQKNGIRFVKRNKKKISIILEFFSFFNNFFSLKAIEK